MTAVNDIIGKGSKTLSAFDDDFFKAMIENVIIRSKTEFEFNFGCRIITIKR